MTSLARWVLPYTGGLYVIFIKVPSEPSSINLPDGGVTVNSGSDPGTKYASNGTLILGVRQKETVKDLSFWLVRSVA